MKKITIATCLHLICLHNQQIAMSDHQKNMIMHKLSNMQLHRLNYHAQFSENLAAIFPEYINIKQTLSHHDFYEGIDYIEQNLVRAYHLHSSNEREQEKIQNQILLLELDRQSHQHPRPSITNINNAAIQAVITKLDL